MTKDGHLSRRAISAGLIAAGALAVSRPAQSAEPSAADKAKAFAALPDWTGVWMGVGTTLFEQKAGAASLNANNPNARDFPPYKPAWEAAYTRFLADVVKTERDLKKERDTRVASAFRDVDKAAMPPSGSFSTNTAGSRTLYPSMMGTAWRSGSLRFCA